MESPLPLWLVLEEESEELLRTRPGLGPDFVRLLDWSFKPEEISDLDKIRGGLKERQNDLTALLGREALCKLLRSESIENERFALGQLSIAEPFPAGAEATISSFLNALLPLRHLFLVFRKTPDSHWVEEVVTRRRPDGNPSRVNRYLLESTFPTALKRIERFAANQIRDLDLLLACLKKKKQQLREVLRKDPSRPGSETKKVLDSSAEISKDDIAKSFNELVEFPDLYLAFPELPEAEWVRRRLPVANSRNEQYDPSHGNRMLLEAAFPEIKKLDDEFLARAYARIHTRRPTAALCLSGGGIRSATFSLGVLQGLAKRNLLPEFDYLSTVSGGGYLGGWLSAWIHRNRAGLEGVSRDLSTPKDSKSEPEHDPVYYLREFSNYLAPKLGLLSGDTWTLGAIYLRNLFLNWLILIPLFAIILSIPVAALAFLRVHAPDSYWSVAPQWRIALSHGLKQSLPAAIAQFFASLFATTLASSSAPPDQRWMVWVSGAAGASSIAYAALAIPSTYADSNRAVRWIVGQGTQRRFLILCLSPRYIAAILFTVYWFWHLAPGQPLASGWPQHLYPFNWQITRCDRLMLYGALVGLWGGVAYLMVSRQFRRNTLSIIIAMTASAAVAGLILYWLSLLSPVWQPAHDHQLYEKLYVCFAVPLFVLAFVVADGVFQGLASRQMKDEDREWVARSAAWVLIAAVMWTVLALLSLFGPSLLMYLKIEALIAALGLGLPSVLGGWSSLIPATASDGAEKTSSGVVSLALKILPLLGLVFILLLGAALALGLEVLLTAITHSLSYGAPQSVEYSLIITNAQWPGIVILGFSAFLFAIMIGAGFVVDVNTFSMHAMYRNRLIRGYLGASRKQGDRSPNLFTGFDRRDNLPMGYLTSQRPLPIMNITLNLVGGVANRLAWQERKAETFTVSPLHSGNFWWGYRDTRRYGGEDKKGISLGTAMSISGAAVSPNCGYASSPVLTFLLAIFNARLGWWLGNPGPAGDSTFRSQTPRFAVTPLFEELIGKTNDYSKYVYLSDGGHFENLGLYEMALRRCHLIVAVDAGADPKYAFTDLGNAVRKIRIDLGIPIVFDVPAGGLAALRKNQPAAKSTKYCAIARIQYSAIDNDAPDGVLIYIKPTLRGDEPADVTEYQRKNSEFPNQSTINQFFDESEFESYRMLGLREIDSILPNPTFTAPVLSELEKAVREYLNQ